MPLADEMAQVYAGTTSDTMSALPAPVVALPPAPRGTVGSNLSNEYGIPPELVDAYFQGPRMEPMPALPSTKQRMKEAALSLIPLVGRSLAAGSQEQRQREMLNWQMRQNQAQEQYRAQEQLVRPLILDQVKDTLAINQKLEKLKKAQVFFMQTQGQGPQEAMSSAERFLGIAQPSEGANMKPYDIELQGGQIVPGVQIGNRFYLPDGKTEFPTEMIARIHPISAVKDPNEGGAYNYQHFEMVDKNAPGGHRTIWVDPRTHAFIDPATGQPLSNVQQYYQPPQPTFGLIQTPEGYTAWNPRNPKAPVTPITNAAGEQVQPKLSEGDKKVWGDALAADTRYAEMVQQKQEAEKGSSQADVALLFNHMAMTIGAVKGARLNNAEIQRAISARPWLEGLVARYRAGVKGPFLSPEQREYMLDQAALKRNESWIQARRTAQGRGIGSTEPAAHPNLPSVQEQSYMTLSVEELGAAAKQGDRLARAELRRRVDEEIARRKGAKK